VIPTGGEHTGGRRTALQRPRAWRQRPRAWRAQTAAELRSTLRRGDAILLNLAIPVGLLVFFSAVKVLPVPAGVLRPVDFLAPGVLALAVMSSSMVSLGIATGFERQYGVLKRLGVTPLGRPKLLAAKITSTAAVEVFQLVVLSGIALAFGWRPTGNVALGVVALLEGTAAFAGLGLLMAGSLRAEVTLAAANGAYILLLLLGGMLFPLSQLPTAVRYAADGLPAGALSQVLRASLTGGSPQSLGAWIALSAWALAGPALASRTFRWE